MKNGLKTVAVLLCVVCALLAAMTGCINMLSYRDNDPALENVANAQIMGMERQISGMTPKVIKVLEKDDHGRVLFSTFNALSSHRKGFGVTAYVICQAVDGEKGYCLPDICYELVQGRSDLPEDRMLDLKARNGWNTEPDKNGWVECGDWTDEETDSHAVWQALAEAAGLEIREDSFDDIYMESDANGLKMLGAVFNVEGEHYTGGELMYRLYLAVFDADNNCVACKEVEDIENLAKVKTELKECVGWAQVFELD